MKTTTTRRSYPSVKKKGEMILSIKEGIVPKAMRKFPSEKKVYALVEKGTANVQSIRGDTIYLIFTDRASADTYMAINEKTDIWEVMELQLWATL